MSQIEDLRQRAAAVRREYAALHGRGWGEPGPPDPQTGERWDAGHVLGHVAEMLPYWTAQAHAVLAGATAMGRDEAGGAQRRTAIDSSHESSPDALLARVDEGLGGVEGLLARVTAADLARPVTMHRADGAQDTAELGAMLEALLVSHAEEHRQQLAQSGG